MKFWFPSTDGAPIIILLMFSMVFCIRGASAEASDVLNRTVEIPCSLDDGNRTDCNNSSPVSPGSSELWTVTNLNSSNGSDVLCLSNECSTKGEQADVTTSHEFPSESALDNFSEIDNQTEDIIMTQHFTNIPTALNETTSREFPSVSALDHFSEIDNQTEAVVMTQHFTNIPTALNETTTTPCPLEGCLVSNESEQSVGDALTPSTNSNNLTESFETTHSVTTTFGLNETLSFKTSNINDSVLVTAEPTETMSNFTDAGEVTTTEDHKNFSMSGTELSHNNTSSVSHTVEAGNSTETDVITEHPTVADDEEEKNASVSMMTSTNESFYNTTELVENTTVYSYPVTRPESLADTTIDATSLDNTTLFYTSSSDSNFSTSVDGNTEFSADTSNTATDTTTTTNTESPSLSPHGVYIIVEVRINCSDNGQEREIALLVAKLLNATLKNENNKGCNYLHNISLSIIHSFVDLTTIRRVLFERLRGVEVVRVLYDESSASTPRNVTSPPPDNDVTQSELILYITLGVSLGAIFLIALAIICFKCCRRRPSKPVDLDVPHLNLRLEDYTLTRIPRPNTCYLDYFRGPIVSEHYSAPSVRSAMNAASESNRGMVQPFDTSVVPLEDAKKLDQVPNSPNRTSCPSTPLRTFGRKDWKNGDKLIYENVISSSTEKLHPDFYKYGYAGTENPTFAA